MLCHLAVTQPNFSKIPSEAFINLAKLPGLEEQLRALVEKGGRAQALVSKVIVATVEHVVVHEKYGRLLTDILSIVPLGTTVAIATEALLKQAELSVVDGPGGGAFVKALQALDQRYGTAVERVVNASLQGLDSKLESKSTADKDVIQDTKIRRQKLSAVLEAAFAGSLRAPLLEAGTTLALAVDAASAGIRSLALEKLDELATSSNAAERDEPKAEAALILKGVLVRRLADDHPGVVQTTLGLRSLLELPPAVLFDGLSACMNSALAAAVNASSKKSQRAAARGIARKVIKLLTGPIAEAQHETDSMSHVAELVLMGILAAPHTRKVASTALKRASKLKHPLLNALQEVVSATYGGRESAGGVCTSKLSPKPKAAQRQRMAGKLVASGSANGYDDAAHNTAVVMALAFQSARDADARKALERLLGSREPRVRALALVVANVAMRLEGGSELAMCVLRRFDMMSSQSKETTAKKVVQFSCDKTSGLAEGAALLALATGSLPADSIEPEVVLTAVHNLPAKAVHELSLRVSCYYQLDFAAA